MFHVLRLDRLVDVHATLEEALLAFGAASHAAPRRLRRRFAQPSRRLDPPRPPKPSTPPWRACRRPAPRAKAGDASTHEGRARAYQALGHLRESAVMSSTMSLLGWDQRRRCPRAARRCARTRWDRSPGSSRAPGRRWSAARSRRRLLARRTGRPRSCARRRARPRDGSPAQAERAKPARSPSARGPTRARRTTKAFLPARERFT
jgi:hypothetical protein